MRKALALLFIVVTLRAYPAGLVRDEILYVSMYRLLATPQAYDGKKVLLHGYLQLAEGSGALFVNETALKYGPKMDSVYVRFTPDQIKKYQSVNEKWVMIEGTFSRPQDERALDFAGTLGLIVSVKRMDGAG